MSAHAGEVRRPITPQEHQLIASLAEMSITNAGEYRFLLALLDAATIGDRQADRLKRLGETYGFARGDA